MSIYRNSSSAIKIKQNNELMTFSLPYYIQVLDKKLPPESDVLLLGLVDGRAMWDNLNFRQHPLGATYEEVYNCLSCNEVLFFNLLIDQYHEQVKILILLDILLLERRLKSHSEYFVKF